jgi:hypothetical protein
MYTEWSNKNAKLGSWKRGLAKEFLTTKLVTTGEPKISLLLAHFVSI